MKFKIKSLLSVLLIVAILFCLGACGKDTSGLGTLELGSSSEGSSSGDAPLAPLGGSESPTTPAPTSEPPESTAQPTSAPTPAPTAQPEKKQFMVDEYNCDVFDCYIPQGWNVTYQVVDAGGGVVRMYVFVQDPVDPNNIIFFISAMEPFYTSLSDKEAALPYLDSVYEWAPVMDELSAKGLLEQWAAAYTLMDATGFSDAVKFFRNYKISSIVSSEVLDGSNSQETVSQVLAEVTIPNATQPYGILYANDFMRMHYPMVNSDYYVSYSNRGFVLSADRFEDEATGLLSCVQSFDFTKFNNKYGSKAGFTADDSSNDIAITNQEIILPENNAFAGK